MPIAELGEDKIDQNCALCGDVHPVPHAQLDVGGDPNVIALPPCPKCGACEFLIRSGSAETQVDEPRSHRHLVEQLAAALVTGSSPNPLPGMPPGSNREE